MLKRLLSLTTFAFASALMARAHAADPPTTGGFALNRFEPSERGSDWFANESLDIRGSGRFAVGVVGDYSSKSLVLTDPSGNEKAAIVKAMVLAHVGGSVILGDRLRLAVSMPFELYGDGRTGMLKGATYPAPPHEQGIGDLRLGVDVRLVGETGGPAVLALGVQAWAPTGNRDQYLSDGSMRVKPRLMVAGDLGPFAYAVQAGAIIRDGKTVGTGAVGSELAVSAAAGLRFDERRLVIGPEVFTTTVFDDSFGKLTTPVEGLFGAHYWIANVFRVGGGVGSGLTNGYGAPEARFLLAAEYAGDVKRPPPPVDHDKDKDGIVDEKDACPAEAGPASDDPGTTGCPDTDKDGIIDRDDACKNEQGPHNADPQANGCPDKDADGVIDAVDACPDKPGVKSTDPKKNGCPPDSDGDGVIDAEDACPDVPGLKTSDPKTNGCPDPDRDKDGVPNDTDACPDEPGQPDPDPKKNGCPKAFVKDGQIKILEQVKFKTGSAVIDPNKSNDETIAAVVKVLTDHPEIKKVRVEGHTDNKGAAAMNKKLSADRAASVVKAIAAKGIDKGRLTSQGFGADRPMASNETEEGRQENRRVEFHIESSDAGGDVK